LQELTLSYKFNPRWFNNVVRDLTLSFVATNPWMIYCKAPFDPELTSSTGTYGQGNDYFMQPSLKSYGFSLKFKF
jgi:putative outer membrane protein